MSAYPLVPFAASLACAVVATAILVRDPRRAESRLAALMMIGPSFWAACEVLWSFQSDVEHAAFWLGLSALGWGWIGPIALHLFLQLTDTPAPRLRRWLPAFYLVSAGLVVSSWLSPWFHPRLFRVEWGWAYEAGPGLIVSYAYTILCIGLGMLFSMRYLRQHSGLQGGGSQARMLIIGLVGVGIATSGTDVLLPAFGMPVPRIGTLAFALFGILVFWSFRFYGYSLLAPGSFTAEILETLPEGVGLLQLDGRLRSANSALAQLMETGRARKLENLRLTDHLSEPIHPTEQPMERQCDLRTLKGRLRPVAMTSRLLSDRRGGPIGLVLVVRDLDEVASLRDRLLLSGRLAAVGQLAAGIAHEINNPLTFIRANLGLLRTHWVALGERLGAAGRDADSEAMLREGEELIDESLQGVDRASAIVRDVRGLAHGGKQEPVASDINKLLEGVLRMASPQLRGRIEAVTEFGEVPEVFGTPHELQQVFLNLVFNSAQAIEERGTIRIRTEHASGMVVVHVEDDGSGIEPEIRDRIFDPFFTTKEVGEGNGLGLGIVYGIVRNYGGDISVESVPGERTCFSVHLPIAKDRIARA